MSESNSNLNGNGNGNGNGNQQQQQQQHQQYLGGGGGIPPARLNKQGTVILLKDPTWQADASQESENDVANFVILCKPGLPKFMV
jgi:hypothetical protein